MTLDLTHKILAAVGLAATTVNADAVGPAVDTTDFSSFAYVGTVANASVDADLAVSIEHSDDGAAWEAAPADDLHNETVEFGNSAPDGAWQLGYRGVKRYVRLAVTVAAGAADLSAVAVLGDPGLRPTY